LATRSCPPSVLAAVPGGKSRACRPTPSPGTLPPSAVLLRIGWMRNISVTVLPSAVTFHTRPRLVVPSPVQTLPSRSKARPLVPGTPVANGADGFMSAAVSLQLTPPSLAAAVDDAAY